MTSNKPELLQSPHDYRYTSASDISEIDKSAIKLNLLAVSTFEGIRDKVKDAIEQPHMFGAQLAAAAAVGAAATRIAYESPQLAKFAMPVMGGMLFFDVAKRVTTSWVAANDTIENPENFEGNKAIIKEAIGGGLFDYATYGLAGGFGVQQVTSRMDSNLLAKRMAALWNNAPTESVPALSSFWNIPTIKTIHNPNHADALFFAKHRPSVVHVRNDSGNGSGFFVDRDLVATNYHVVRGNLEYNYITDHLGRTFRGRMVSRDLAADLALIKLEKVPKDVIPQEVSLGAAGLLKRGEKLRAISHPENSPRAAISSGNFQGHRPLDFGQKTIAEITAGLSSRVGSSGGPIFDASGKVVSLITKGDNANVSGASVEHLRALIKGTKDFAKVDRYEWLNVHTTTYPPRPNRPFKVDTQVDFRDRFKLADRFHERAMFAMIRQEEKEAIEGWTKFGIHTTAGAALKVAGSTSLMADLLPEALRWPTWNLGIRFRNHD